MDLLQVGEIKQNGSDFDMECPNCGDRNTTVKDSRKVEMNVFRTRHCNKCGNTFYTEEVKY